MDLMSNGVAILDQSITCNMLIVDGEKTFLNGIPLQKKKMTAISVMCPNAFVKRDPYIIVLATISEFRRKDFEKSATKPTTFSKGLVFEIIGFNLSHL